MRKELIEQLAKESGIEFGKYHGNCVFTHDKVSVESLEAFAKAYQAAAPIDNGVREALEEISNWLVCYPIATADDMAQSFEYMSKLASNALIPSTQAPNTSGVRDETK